MTVLLHLALRLIILFSVTCMIGLLLLCTFGCQVMLGITEHLVYYLCTQTGDVHTMISMCPFFSSVYIWPLQFFLGIWWGSRRWRWRQGGWRGALSPVPLRSGLTTCLQNVWDRASIWLMKQGVPLLRCFSTWLGWSFRTYFQETQWGLVFDRFLYVQSIMYRGSSAWSGRCLLCVFLHNAMAIRSCLLFVGSVHEPMAKPPRFSSVLGNLVAALDA